MSFDVFFQGFIAGESSERGGAQMREILAPHVTDEDGSFLHVRFGDGEADIYLSDDGMMANHVAGRDPWDLLVRGAQAANWVIMPMDCPTCLTQPGQREELPEELDDDLVVIDTGADLLRVIEARGQRHDSADLCHAHEVDSGMSEHDADCVAATIRDACSHDVEVLADGEFFVVQVAHATESGSETFTLYDETDWDWLRERIAP